MLTFGEFVPFTKQEAQLNEVLSASNLDPTALTVVTRKLEVSVMMHATYV